MKPNATPTPNDAACSAPEKEPRYLRFDVFKGEKDAEGKIQKTKSVGVAFKPKDSTTFNLYLKTFTQEVFYLMPECMDMSRGDYTILTRVPSHFPNRKYFWNSVGEGWYLKGPNKGLMHLKWDMLGVDDIFLCLTPEVRPDPIPPKKNADH